MCKSLNSKDINVGFANFVTRIFSNKFVTKLSRKYNGKNICYRKVIEILVSSIVTELFVTKLIPLFMLKIENIKILPLKYWWRFFKICHWTITEHISGKII